MVHSVEEALEAAKDDNIFVIGGGKIYAEFLPLADKIYLTEIDAQCPDADTFFPAFDKSLYTRTVLGENEEDGISFPMYSTQKIKLYVDKAALLC